MQKAWQSTVLDLEVNLQFEILSYDTHHSLRSILNSNYLLPLELEYSRMDVVGGLL